VECAISPKAEQPSISRDYIKARCNACKEEIGAPQCDAESPIDLGTNRIKKPLKLIEDTFWTIKSRIKFKMTADLKIYENDHPVVREVVRQIETLLTELK
jgi:hypothetical protein